MGASVFLCAASTRRFYSSSCLPFPSIPPTGAAVVLLYSLPLAPPSQPRPLLLGQVVSSIIGCSISRLFSLAGPTQYSLYFSSEYADGGAVVWIAGALATSLSLAAMKVSLRRVAFISFLFSLSSHILTFPFCFYLGHILRTPSWRCYCSPLMHFEIGRQVGFPPRPDGSDLFFPPRESPFFSFRY